MLFTVSVIPIRLHNCCLTCHFYRVRSNLPSKNFAAGDSAAWKPFYVQVLTQQCGILQQA
jgi:hypothetical protein